MPVKVSVIILTWNSLELLKRCLKSIKNTTKLDSYEIIIIDNNSTDATADFLKTIEGQQPYRFIFNKHNNGVGPARNQGIKIARGDYILILDVDTVVSAGAIEKLVDYLDKHPECGLVAPKLTDADGHLQFTCRKFPTILSKFLRRMSFEWAQKRLIEDELRNWDHSSQRQVDYVIGACQLFRKSVVDKVGLLDEKIFYGPEDVDFCLRIWQAGYKVVYNPDAVIIHDEQRITKKRLISKISWEHARGLTYYFWKHKYLFSKKSLYKSIPQKAPTS